MTCKHDALLFIIVFDTNDLKTILYNSKPTIKETKVPSTLNDVVMKLKWSLNETIQVLYQCLNGSFDATSILSDVTPLSTKYYNDVVTILYRRFTDNLSMFYGYNNIVTMFYRCFNKYQCLNDASRMLKSSFTIFNNDSTIINIFLSFDFFVDPSFSFFFYLFLSLFHSVKPSARISVSCAPNRLQ